MKRFVKKYLLVMVVSLSSCQFLEKFPDSNADVRIDTKEKVQELLTGAYPQASYFRFLEMRTDNVGDKRNTLEAPRLDEAMYYWKDYDEEEPDSPKAYWMECYRGIAQANKALEALAGFADKQDPQVQALYAEALLIRAYLHFMVANIWAPVYEGEEESKQLPGIVYVETPEKHALVKYKMENLADTYRKIERDLRLGLAWVRDDYYAQPKFHFNKKAAYAFAVRFFSYTGQWQEVVDYSAYVLGTQPAKAITSFLDVSEQRAEERMAYYASEQNPSNLLMTVTESLWYKYYIDGRFGLDEPTFQKVVWRIGAKTLYQIAGYQRMAQHNRLNTAYFPKFSHFRNAEGLLNSQRGHFCMNVLFTTEEVLLHRAEAYAMLDNKELALNDIVTFFLAKHIIAKGVGEAPEREELDFIPTSDRDRIQPYYRPLSASQASLLYVISEMSRQQFMHEGMRWFDLRRYHMSVDRNRTGEARNVNWVLRPEDNRKVLPFPNEAINYIEKIVDNE
ncbi:MAG: RagB/SusD family nutrient uptake outer membrane protein [Bacteroides sp.]|jgi:hypothetical protein|nr:RagB/SusD family nutrient uptake outer membrane protein [Bacteroides sp.]